MSFTPTFPKQLYGAEIEIGQLLYAKHGRDCRAWIVQDVFRRGLFGDWAVRIVSENDLTGPTYAAWVNEMTGQPVVPPALHPKKRGTTIYTATGWRLKAIPGGAS